MVAQDVLLRLSAISLAIAESSDISEHTTAFLFTRGSVKSLRNSRSLPAVATAERQLVQDH